MIELDNTYSSGAKIRAIGIGGGGCNSVDNMIIGGLEGVDFIAANSDTQALEKNKANIKIQVGKKIARGLGVGGNPEIGKKCIEEDLDEVHSILAGSDMVFISAGMGGGTGTGGSPQIAKIAKDLGALVVAIVTKPFKMEGSKKLDYAEKGIEELRKNVDSLIVVSNQKLLEVIDKNTPFNQATKKVDEVLLNATKGIVDIIYKCGYMNVDFADIRNIMEGSGDALIGIGMAKGTDRALNAVQNALNSPLLEGVSITGAKGILLNITCDESLTMNEIETITTTIQEAAGEDAYLKFGIVSQPEKTEELIVTVVATGFERVEEVSHITPELPSVQVKPQAKTIDRKISKPAKEQPLFENIELEPLIEDIKPMQRPVYKTPESFIINQNDYMNNYDQVASPMAPKGTNALKQYDTPAYERKIVTDMPGKIEKFVDQRAAQEEPTRRVQERPAFLRKIMD
jgi:cell division protein FtsZ